MMRAQNPRIKEQAVSGINYSKYSYISKQNEH